MAALRCFILVFFCMLFQCYGHKDLPTIIREVSQASNKFGINLYRTKTLAAGTERTNIFFSPLSIFTALAMVNTGSRGDTSYQLQQALNWNIVAHPNDEITANAKMANFLRAAVQTSAANPVKFANKLWLQKFFCTSQCKRYSTDLVKYYETELGIVDFAFASEKARISINQWISDRTAGKIKELMEPGSISGLTRLVITNAVYFKSNWKYKFDAEYTFRDNFFVSKEKTVKVDYMTMKSKMMFTQDAENMVLELPYAAPNLSMIIFLPRELDGIGKLEHSFTDKLLRSYLGKLKEEKINLYLPRFKLDSDTHLKDYLSLMGVTDLFDPIAADLSGITGYKGLFVTHAIHKAYIEVNEQGTEAAAASGIGASTRSFDPDVYLFSADRPFLFSIIHRPTLTMLFNGEIIDPTMEKTSRHHR